MDYLLKVAIFPAILGGAGFSSTFSTGAVFVVLNWVAVTALGCALI